MQQKKDPDQFEAKPINGHMPTWIRPDGIFPDKWNFHLGSFDFSFSDPLSLHLQVQGTSEAVSSYSWKQLSDYLKLASTRYHSLISPYFPKGISAILKHEIAASFVRCFPLVQDRYDELRAMQLSSELEHSNVMSKTSASYRTLAVRF